MIPWIASRLVADAITLYFLLEIRHKTFVLI